MIRSTADLIDDFTTDVIEEKRPSNLLRKRSGNDDLNRIKEHVLHRLLSKAYFLRLSWTHKLQYLILLTNNIRSIDSLALLLNTLYTAYTKVAFYVKCTPETNFIFDKTLRDHNRMLEDDVIEKEIENDVKFYKELDDIDQISFIIGLFRISGGSVIRKMYTAIKKEYLRRILETNSNLTLTKTVDESTPKLLVVESIESITDEVIEQRKHWDTTIKKYKQEIETKINKLKQANKKDKGGKKDKKGKGKKKDKDKKKAGKGKDKKNKKSKGDSGDEGLNWV